MIFGNITDWKYYFGKTKYQDELYQELQSISSAIKNGIYKLNDHIYYKVMSYETQASPSVIESHKKEVDVQIVLSGKEHIKVYDPSNVQVTMPYNAEKDCQFYSSEKVPFVEFDLIPGKMAVFFPNDIHACQFVVGDKTEPIKKIVFKIDEKLFTH